MLVQSETKLKLDVVTVVEKEVQLATEGRTEVQLITEGLTEAEQAAEDERKKNPDNYFREKVGVEAKTEREAGFPLQLLERGYGLDITTAEASRPADKRTILNTIAGVAPEFLQTQAPDLSCPEFERVNRRLRGVFANAAVPKAAQEGRLEAALAHLAEDTEVVKLRLDFQGCDPRDDQILREFSEWEGLGRLQELRHLTVEGRHYSHERLPDSIALCKQLTDLDLSGGCWFFEPPRDAEGGGCAVCCPNTTIGMCTQLKHVNLARNQLCTLPDMSGLSSLETLNLQGCIPLIVLPESLAGCSKLKVLNLSECSMLERLPERCARY